MKHLIDLCALWLCLGTTHHDFSQKSEVSEKDSFGSFSIRAVPPAVKNSFTYTIDENFFLEYSASSSDYSKLEALKEIWIGKLPPKNTKPVR